MIFAIAPKERKASRLPKTPNIDEGSLKNELDDIDIIEEKPDANCAPEMITTRPPRNERKANKAIRAFNAFLCAGMLITDVIFIINLRKNVDMILMKRFFITKIPILIININPYIVNSNYTQKNLIILFFL